MRRAIPAVVITVIGLAALASFKTAPAARSVAKSRPATSRRAATSPPATAPPTTAPPATAPSGTAPPPPAGTTPATTPPTTAPSSGSQTRTFDGDPFDNRYGTVQVRITVTGHQIVDVTPLQMPYDHPRSQYISEQAGPYLQQEALQAQSANIDVVSGATYTSQGYAQSLQSALDKAGMQSHNRPMPLQRRVEEMWGTVISVDVRDPIDVAVIDKCFAWFRRVDDLFSTWRDDTEIMRIARGSLRVDDASAEVREVLALCEEIKLESGGAFDIAVGAHPNAPPAPGRAALDPSGIVKGWAVARAGDVLARAGARCFFVNAGGDVLTRGRPEGTEGWRVGIQHPWEHGRVAAVLCVADAGVATSGRYERGDHVLDPRSGLPARELTAVTVVGPDLALADAYATAAFVLGPSEGMRWIAARAGYEGMAITDSRAVLFTPGFDRYRVP